MEDVVGLHWRKSSYSSNGGGNCVEVGTGLPGKIAVRDSKNLDGPVLSVGPEEWDAFIAGAKRGEFDL
jgi:hypothetical protein